MPMSSNFQFGSKSDFFAELVPAKLTTSLVKLRLLCSVTTPTETPAPEVAASSAPATTAPLT